MVINIIQEILFTINKFIKNKRYSRCSNKIITFIKKVGNKI